MKNEKTRYSISARRIKRLRAQGYFNCTDEEIARYAVGNRFAYQLCLVLLVIGLVFKNIPILGLLMVIAFLSILLPYHPFDYLYNYGIRHWLNRPEIPPRSNQLKFACGLATVLLGAIIYLFSMSFFLGIYYWWHNGSDGFVG